MVGTLFIDLSKAFDFVNHDLLLKKLEVYHFSQHSIDVFKSYLRNRKQLVQLDNIRSSFEVIKTGVPQGSQLGPLMFLLFIIFHYTYIILLLICMLMTYANLETCT